MEDITKLFCLVDDFCRDIEKNFADKLLPNGKKPTRVPEITHSEIITIIPLYQQSPCENFKAFYLHYLTLLYKSEFSKLPSYTRFVALKAQGFVAFSYAITVPLADGQNILESHT